MENHFFYALALPAEVKEEIGRRMEIMQSSLPFKKWVYPEDTHITLAFLGHAENVMLNASLEMAEARLSGFAAFPMEINVIGTFGSRVFWAGLKHEEMLGKIRDTVYHICCEAGFQLEKRPFSPHITLARNWEGKEPLSTIQLMENDLFAQEPLKFEAKKVVLYKTRVGKVPKYESAHTFYLSGE
ncbi:RNA 2',3'-cyclic phosphodiesterase [Bacillus massilinigeriensis]|uniref:RNA 2',3'-cyclic phosphodiesterase n=1 Tax=Bacillus mediterraneensis TaxID=1805474 RepID=UPI0009F3DC55|nr:RNA 2',3'-cyclic phosphodiesterase [Bacillus mediterraneensis]